MAVSGLNGTSGLLVGVPAIVVGNPARSRPVAASRACRYQWGLCALGPSLTFAVRYTEPVAGSYTGAEVDPTVGARSPQLRVAAGHAGPRFTAHLVDPLTGSRPYTLLFSVAAISVPATDK